MQRQHKRKEGKGNGLNVSSHCPQIYVCVKALIPNAMGFGDGAFRRLFGLDEVVRMGPHGDIGAFIKDIRAVSLFLTLPSHLLCTEGRWPSDSQEDRFHWSTVLAGTRPCGSLISDSQFPDL